MAEKIGVARVACNTSSGNQAITVAVGGETPVAALFVISRATSDGVAVDHGVIGMGAADGTRQWAMSCAVEHNVGTMDTFKRATDDQCVMLLNPATQAIDAEATLVSFAANTVTINWASAPAAAYLLTVTAFAGSGITAYASTVTTDPDEDDAVDVTAPNFEPDVVFAGTVGDPFDDASNTYGYFSPGVAINDAPVVQGSVSFRSQDGAAASAVYQTVSSNYACAQQNNSTTLYWAAEIGSFDSQGFSVTTREGGSASDVLGYLALKFDASAVWAGTIDSKTSTGTQAYTGPNFQPQFLMLLCSFIDTLDTGVSTGDAGTQGIGLADGSNEYCSSFQDEDGAGTSDTQSLSDDSVVNLPQDDGTAGLVATLSSFDATGFTLDWTTIDSTARKLVALAIEEPATTVSDSYTADAVLSRVVADSFTADASLVKVASGSFTADARIGSATSESGSFTGDAAILRTESGSFTADALIQPSQAGSFTADAVLENTYSGSFFADAYIQSSVSLVTGSFSARAWIVASGEEPTVTFMVEDTQPPNPRGDPKGRGYVLRYPEPRKLDGNRRPVGAVGQPWVEITFEYCDAEVFDWYNAWVPAGELYGEVTSVQCWDPYKQGGADWELFYGPEIRVWRPTAEGFRSGYYYGVRILITNLH